MIKSKNTLQIIHDIKPQAEVISISVIFTFLGQNISSLVLKFIFLIFKKYKRINIQNNSNSYKYISKIEN